MVSSKIKPGTKLLLESMATPLQLLGLSPNSITILSFLLAILATFIFFFFNHITGFLIFIISLSLDSLDGALARKIKQVTKFGAYLDSVTDKVVEGLVFLCFGVYNWPLAFLAGISSIIVSYSRHRADEFRVKIKSGLFERPERMGCVLISGLLLEIANLQNFMPLVLILSSILSMITIIQRVNEAKKLL